MRKSDNTGGLIKLLIALLLTCTIAEAGIASYVGVTMQINRQANEEAAARYEEYQEQRKQNQEEPAVIQYMGPGVHVSNSELVKGSWEPAKPVQRSDSVVSEYTASEIQKGDIPEIDTHLDIKKTEVKPVTPSEQPKQYAETPKTSDGGGKKAADAPKPSGGQSSGGVSSQPKSSDASGDSAVTSKPANTPKASSGGGGASSGSAATVKNSDGTYKHDFSGGRVLGTKNSDKYHNSDCIGARKIPPENEVWYSSVSDAVAAGRDPCGSCYR